MSSFRSFVWDPLELVSQMICMQTVFYTAESASLIVYSMTGFTPTLAHIFAAVALREMVVIQFIASVACGVALRYVVQRAKQCLDVACTILAFHLLFVVISTHALATQLLWWAVQIGSIGVCTLLGEHLCMQAESQEIKLGPPVEVRYLILRRPKR
ncbi:hypothetical protein OESDEN_12038 [Oesophagostomum dentatum]|uniref:Uncharacterized protein n=1 Tax=Oesophagostomum dentatum TaxID=61180 RepID=A0A0B1SWB9_OESDE|nr:hypothetical protein OESDEN_12038 [Oesophagostomum dentatum]